MKTAILLIASALASFAQTGRAVSFRIPPSPSANVSGYNVYMKLLASGTDCSVLTGTVKQNVAPIAPTAPITFDLPNVPFGTYCASATALRGTDESLQSVPVLVVVAPRPDPPGPPTVTQPSITADNVIIININGRKINLAEVGPSGGEPLAQGQ